MTLLQKGIELLSLLFLFDRKLDGLDKTMFYLLVNSFTHTGFPFIGTTVAKEHKTSRTRTTKYQNIKEIK